MEPGAARAGSASHLLRSPDIRPMSACIGPMSAYIGWLSDDEVDIALSGFAVGDDVLRHTRPPRRAVDAQLAPVPQEAEAAPCVPEDRRSLRHGGSPGSR